MCELLGLSARWPATLRVCLGEFARRGGGSGPHKDGWGVAWYEDQDVRLVKESESAHGSTCLAYLRENPFRTRLAIAHIRRATQGGPSLRNSQPFMREVHGSMHVFAHNGDLDRTALRARLPLGLHRPVGESDSEYAFCGLAARMQALWSRHSGVPPLERRLEVVSAFAALLRPLGPANFLYADGDTLFAPGHQRRQDDHRVAPPGLHMLVRHAEADGERQQAVLFASVPVTAEAGWRPLDTGEIVVARDGVVEGTDRPLPYALQPVRKEGGVHEHAH